MVTGMMARVERAAAVGLGILVVAWGGGSLPIAWADVVRLKNGNRLEGDVNRLEDGRVEVSMPGVGSLIFPESEIESIEASDSDFGGVERVDSGDTPTSAKRPRPDDVADRRDEHAEQARTLLWQAQRSEPSIRPTLGSEELAQPYLAHAIELYGEAESEAQRALELDRHYESDEADTRDMKKLIQDARRAVSRIRARMNQYESKAAAKTKEEEDLREREKTGFKIDDLGTTKPAPFSPY